jgi:hypothetical protein
MKLIKHAALVAASQTYAHIPTTIHFRRFSFVLAFLMVSAISTLTGCEEGEAMTPNADEGTGLCCGCKIVSGQVTCPGNANTTESK